ncbi:ABC transporter substrate-binding protein, partial [Leptolyngbya sp. FACHB-36]|nr:ABC transporter substrate-binding protein [Leptolyngbya sp. FACHB-36]
MLRKLGRYGLLAIALMLAISLTNCTGSNPVQSPTGQSNSASVPQGALVYGAGGQPVNLEPGNITDGNSITVQDQIYNRLIEFKP